MKKALILGLFVAMSAAVHASRLMPPTYLTAGSNPRGLVSVDFNGDGFGDAVVAAFGSATLIGQACPADAGAILIYQGSAAGLTLRQTLSLAGDAPRGLASADLNGDGRPDILASLYCGGQLAVFLQAADGSFGAPQFYPVGSQPVGVAVQARPDGAWVAVANYGSSNVSLFSAQHGVLTLLATHPAASSPTDLEFYGAGSAKASLLLVTAYGSNQLLRLTLDPGGSLVASEATPISGQPCKVVVGDLNGDGLPDAAVSRFTDSALSVFLGLPSGALSTDALATGLQGSHPNGLSLGQLGASARLALSDRDSDQLELARWTPQGLSSSATVLIPDAAGNTGTYGPVETALSDVNGDGLLDVLVTHMRSGRLAVLLQARDAAPEISSDSHPDPQGWSASTQLRAQWLPAPSLDPVQGYRVVLDEQAGTVPPVDAGLQSNASAVFTGLSTGEHWLHVQPIDAAGLAGETGHYRVGVTASMSRENTYNFPNPSRDGRTTIRFPLLQAAAVEIRIYDEVGQLVWTRDLSAAETVAGLNKILWDGHNGVGREVANGGYVLTVKSGNILVTKKIAIIR